MPPAVSTHPERPTRFRFPAACTILLALIVMVAATTWIIPAGQDERVASDVLGKDFPIAGTYAPTDANPQGFFDVVLAPIAGFYDPGNSTAIAINVTLFVLMIGGYSDHRRHLDSARAHLTLMAAGFRYLRIGPT